MSVRHDYDPPERFVAGTVGQPGARTFFIQARAGFRITSVALEKQQVQVLAERMDELLDQVRTAGQEYSGRVPEAAPSELLDGNPLEHPIEEEFRVGTMTLAFETSQALIVVELFAGEDTENDEVLSVRITPEQARAFAARAKQVVAAGRPPCPFCEQPLDPAGHLCPRQNGFRRIRPT